jgi:hypothetical protein
VNDANVILDMGVEPRPESEPEHESSEAELKCSLVVAND